MQVAQDVKRGGKQVVATRDLNLGTIVLCETCVERAAYVEFEGCHKCLQMGEKLNTCDSCMRCYCDNCLLVHEDCQFFKQASKFDVDLSIALLVFRIATSSSDSSAIFLLESHVQDLEPSTRYQVEQVAIIIKPMSQLASEQIVQLFGIVYSNAHAFYVNQKHAGTALFLHGSMFNHSCIPNCCFTVSNDTITVRLIRNVCKGEELCIHYCDLLLPTHKRLKYLEQSKFFTCKCERCISPSELGLHYRSFKCLSCSQGLMVPFAKRFAINVDELMQITNEDDFLEMYAKMQDEDVVEYVCNSCNACRDLERLECSINREWKEENVFDEQKWMQLSDSHYLWVERWISELSIQPHDLAIWHKLLPVLEKIVPAYHVELLEYYSKYQQACIASNLPVPHHIAQELKIMSVWYT